MRPRVYWCSAPWAWSWTAARNSRTPKAQQQPTVFLDLFFSFFENREYTGSCFVVPEKFSPLADCIFCVENKLNPILNT